MKNVSNFTLGIIYAVVGVVLFSTKAVMVKMAYKYGIDSVSLLFFRMLFALPFYIGIILWKKKQVKIKNTSKDILWLIFFGIIGYYLSSLFDFVGLQYLKAGLERIILFCYPTLIILFTWWFFKKKPTSIQFWAILITYVGIVIVFWNEIGISGNDVIYGAIFILLSAITYALYIVGSGWLIPKFGVLLFTSYAMVVSSICVILHYALTHNFDLFNYPSEVYFIGVAMAVFATIIPSFLVSSAIEKLGASTYAIFGSLGPISTIILAYLLLEEEITMLQILGIVIVLAGVSIVSKKGTSKKKLNTSS